jgi:hypothetical protein
VATSRIIFTPPGDEERIRRAAVVEARTWLRTPYHHWAEMKHVGVDCAHLVLAVYRSVGLDFGAAKPGYVHPQWFQSASPPEFLLNAGRMFAAEVPGPPERLPKEQSIQPCGTRRCVAQSNSREAARRARRRRHRRDGHSRRRAVASKTSENFLGVVSEREGGAKWQTLFRKR